ncbi:GNAT family N-acetyltransferase [Dyella mobilis]|uniref:GNAT family N-acetyltransferase n=1 Tax=Dyella mobilis TaxID=1849582 RepID=A0ABS2KA23_9GAMM|nr:GNAT family N-acetyltransferase [Dyella mobilis]MBM7128032.1 GNAT family N-acetyltransferase [Dyella mobilis]GLR00075.1 N-acetyltransferase [Dyella mobilis]
MSTPHIIVTDAPEAADLALISDGLDQFNVDVSGIKDRRPLAVLIKDPETRETIGGVTGRTSMGLLFLDVFFVPEALRGAGIGSQVLQMAEAEGRRRGCRTAVLYTISFQAPEFYRKHGWREFGAIPCDPPGTSRVFFTKELIPAA